MSSSDPPLRIEAYIQSLTPNKNCRIGALLDHLEQLETAEIIASSKVYVVGAEICPETALKTRSGRHLYARILQFRHWAEHADKRLDSFFQPQSATSLVGNRYETIQVPTFTLAEFADETLQFVTPCTDGDTHYTPQDRLDVLSAIDRGGDDRQSLRL